jgi:hypothetical protein
MSRGVIEMSEYIQKIETMSQKNNGIVTAAEGRIMYETLVKARVSMFYNLLKGRSDHKIGIKQKYKYYTPLL